jgi:hypothetical protein
MVRWRALLGTVVILIAASVFWLPSADGGASNAKTIVGSWSCCGATGGAAAQNFIIDGTTGTGQIPGGGQFATITDSQNGDSVTIVTTYPSGYVATFKGTISSNGDQMSGTWTSNSNQAGTWVATRFSNAKEMTVKIGLPSRRVALGATFKVTITVLAGQGGLTNVDLAPGLMDSNRIPLQMVKEAAIPSFFNVAGDQSRSFTYELKAIHLGANTLFAIANATGPSGAVKATGDAKLNVGNGIVAGTAYMRTVAPIATTIGTPNQIFRSMSHNLINAGITIAVILFITFPANIFNQTFSSNYGEILIMIANGRRRLRRIFGLKSKDSSDGEATNVTVGTTIAVADAPDKTSRFWFYSVLAVGAVFGGLLNPHFGLNRQSADGFLATLLAFAFGAIVSWYVAKTFRARHHFPTHTYLRALPLGLAVAALCVLVSRISDFQPGYLYGVVVSVAFVETLEERHNAHMTVIATMSTLVVAMLAWFAWIPINHLATLHGGNIVIALADDVLGSIFVGGLVGTVVGLLPLEFLPGGTLARWRRDVWAIVFFIAMFLLIAVELRPAAGPTHHGNAPIVTAIVLFLFFGGSTFWMKSYFAKRAQRKVVLAGHVQEMLSSSQKEIPETS